MKKLHFAIFLMLCYLFTNAQSITEDFSFNGNSIKFSTDLKATAKKLKQSARSSVQGNTQQDGYFFVQMSAIPNAKQVSTLKNQGVLLLNYVSNNVYFAKLDATFYSQRKYISELKGIAHVEPMHKIDPSLHLDVIPDYAASGGDNVKVVVSYYKGVKSNEVETNLKRVSVKSVSIKKNFNEVYLEVPKSKIEELAKLDIIQNIELVPAPSVHENVPGRSSHKANILNGTILGLGYGLTGKGVKIGVWDSNIEAHKDLKGRVTVREFEDSEEVYHGMHVTGTMAGAGLIDPRAKGMAPEAEVFSWNFNTQSNGLTNYQERDTCAVRDGIEITQNSFGPNLTAGINTIRYNVNDRGDDAVMVKFPYLLNIYSNGNAQAVVPGGFNTSTKSSKNSLHVAANDHDETISTYSSFGPTVDGRLVPQIAAIGSDVYSIFFNNSYQTIGGTSMACPGVSGVTALLYERYKKIYNQKPLASLMKALVCNTAKEAGNLGPDYKYGFGNINGLRAIKALDKVQFYTNSLTNGDIQEKIINVPSGIKTLKVMLAYSDVPGTPGSSSVLVNNLDLKVESAGVNYQPWVLNPLQPNSLATRGVDNLNNIEQVTIENPSAGACKIIISGSRIPLDKQEYAVTYEFVKSELVLTYPIGDEKLDPNTEEFIRWDYEGDSKNMNIEYSTDGGLTYKIIATNVPASQGSYLWQVPAEVSSTAKIRISAGTFIDQSKANFTIMAEPKNLKMEAATCGTNTFKLEWDEVPGAKYEVLKLNDTSFDSIAITEDLFYSLTLQPGDDNWFTVKAIDKATGITSERVKAVNAEPIVNIAGISLPYKEPFDVLKPSNYQFINATDGGYVGYKYIDSHGVQFRGPSPGAAWVASTNANAFANNPTKIKKLSFCNIDATAFIGKKLRLKFDLNTITSTANENFFRVVVNGVPVANIFGVTVYGGAAGSGNQQAIYDLSSLAGTNFTLNFEAVNNTFNAGATPAVLNSFTIDNVELFEATANDIELYDVFQGSGFTDSETVTVGLYNYSPVAVSNIPVSYKLNNNEVVNEVIPGPIEPLTDFTYDFITKANYTVVGPYTLSAKVSLLDDTVAENNEFKINFANNGTEIPVLIGAATTTTCSAILTDAGGRYGNYVDNVNATTTFVPATAGKAIKIDFSEFDLEKDYDYVYVYDGTSTTAPLLGRFTNLNDQNPIFLPPSFTSTATGGELTIRLTSDGGVVAKGFVATISCVDKPLNDMKILSIVAPEPLGLKTSTNVITISVKNVSAGVLTNVPVFYQVDSNTKVSEIIPTINAAEVKSYSFTTTADLSAANGTFEIKSGIDQVDDNVDNNELKKTVKNQNDLPVHNNTDGYAITKLKWDAIENNSGITPYSDFKSIKIPVYAGSTYQPNVSVSKADKPLTRDQTNDVGIFTMMVIDLNGDGNLTDEFYAGNFWVNTLTTLPNPANSIIASSTSTHYFRDFTNLAGGVRIPATTTPGDKLVRIIHMYRSPREYFNVVLGPTFDNMTTSRPDFEVEEYTMTVKPFLANDVSVDAILYPQAPGLKPATVAVAVKNYSTVSLSNIPVAFKVNGGAEVVENVVGPIAAGASANYIFTAKADLTVIGTNTIEIYTKLQGDPDATNDMKTATFTSAQSVTNVSGNFDGVNDFAITSAASNMNLTNNYTFEAWINQKSTDSGIFSRILDKNRVLFFVHNTANLSLYKENSLVVSITGATPTTGSAPTYVINTGLNSFKQNKWHHVAFSVSSTNVYTIYIDGVVAPYTVTSTNTAGIAAGTNSTSPAYFGNNAGLARGLNGAIDEVRIWNTVRTAQEIADNSMTSYIGSESGLIGYYKFNEGTYNYVNDFSVNDRPAVVRNADTSTQGESQFWNVPKLLSGITIEGQKSVSYDKATKTYIFVLDEFTTPSSVLVNYDAQMKSVVKVDGMVQINGVSLIDLSNPKTVIVEGVGFNLGLTETYTILVLIGKNNQADLLSYEFKAADNNSLSQDIPLILSGQNAFAKVPSATNVTQLRASFTISKGASLFMNDILQTNPQNVSLDYTDDTFVKVVSEDGITTKIYRIYLDARNGEAKFIMYEVTNQVGTSSIDETAKTIETLVNNNADLNNITPNFIVSNGASTTIDGLIQNSGITKLNALPANYIVTSEDELLSNTWVANIAYKKPTLVLLGEPIVTIDKQCDFVEPGFTAFDNLENDLTNQVVITGKPASTEISGSYTITYTIKDSKNNESIKTRQLVITDSICAPLSTVENSIQGFNIFPNPVTNKRFTVSTSSNESKQIMISDLLGRKFFEKFTNEEEINIDTIPVGIYLVKIIQNGKTAIAKVIIE
jgi:Subtilase family/Concanavalin A-like lectin/glucanases superfamily/Domain of unknown function (DUF5011)/Secretion system C-terminal sorting domain/CUB domain